jgi:hypothetical protein
LTTGRAFGLDYELCGVPGSRLVSEIVDDHSDPLPMKGVCNSNPIPRPALVTTTAPWTPRLPDTGCILLRIWTVASPSRIAWTR